MIEEIVNLAIINNLKIRDSLDAELKREVPISSYVKEFCTIHIDIGRRSGKTRYIDNKALENDLIIVLDERFKKQFNKTNAFIMTAREVLKKKDITGFTNIYIDEPQLISSVVDIDLIYEKIRPSIEATYFLLGR